MVIVMVPVIVQVRGMAVVRVMGTVNLGVSYSHRYSCG